MPLLYVISYGRHACVCMPRTVNRRSTELLLNRRCVPNKWYMAFGTDTVHQIEWGSTFIRSSHSFVFFWYPIPSHSIPWLWISHFAVGIGGFPSRKYPQLEKRMGFCSFETIQGHPKGLDADFPAAFTFDRIMVPWQSWALPGLRWVPSGYDIRSLPWEITIFKR